MRTFYSFLEILRNQREIRNVIYLACGVENSSIFSEGKIYETKTNKHSFIESCLNTKKKQRMLLYVADARIVYQTAGTVDSQLNCSVESSMIYKNNFSVSNFPFSLITCPLKHEEQVAMIKFNIHALLGKIVKATDLFRTWQNHSLNR